MRKAELTLVGAVAISLLATALTLPGSGILLTVTIMMLAFFYLYTSTAHFNNVRWKEMRNSSMLSKVSRKYRMLALYAGVVISMALLSVLFQANHWPSANILTVVSALALLPVTAFCIYKIAGNSMNKLYRKTVQRTASYFFVAVCGPIFF